jgi:hypothetical protein
MCSRTPPAVVSADNVTELLRIAMQRTLHLIRHTCDVPVVLGVALRRACPGEPSEAPLRLENGAGVAERSADSLVLTQRTTASSRGVSIERFCGQLRG